MFDKYFVSRKNYDKDLSRVKSQLNEVTRELRETGKAEGFARQNVAVEKSRNGGLENEIIQLQKRLKFVPITRDLKQYMNPVPEKEVQRKEYMATVAGFFEGGLREKLNYMHQEFRNQTGMFPLTERETDFFRSCINVTGLLLDWGEESVAEHRGNIAGARGKSESDAFSTNDDEGERAKKNINEALK